MAGLKKTLLSKILFVAFLLLGSCTLETGASKAAVAVVAKHKFPGQGVVKTFVKTIQESRKHLAAAAVARSLSVFCMFPVDTLKTRMQMGKEIDWSLGALYGGVGGSLFGQVPYG